MNTHSSTDHPNKPRHLIRSSEHKTVALSRLGRSHRTWQARRSTTTSQSAETLLNMTETEAVLRQRALSEARGGNFSKAIALFNQLLNTHPFSARDYNNRGLVHFQQGNLDLALADYNQALFLNPNLDGAYNNRANYYAAIGLFLEAVLDYDAALDLNPDNIRAWINQGITFRDLQMYERALESFDMALSLGRLQSHIYAERGRTYYLRGDWNCAMADFQRAILHLEDTEAVALGNSHRLRMQLNEWLDELLSPLEFGP